MSGLARYHEELFQVMAKHKGEVFTAAQIKEIFRKEYPDLRVDFVQPSDHCIDHHCSESCECSKTDNAIFSRLDRNKYKVL